MNTAGRRTERREGVHEHPRRCRQRERKRRAEALKTQKMMRRWKSRKMEK
jgi:hypothetical protein